jgi:hypothetical protein
MCRIWSILFLLRSDLLWLVDRPNIFPFIQLLFSLWQFKHPYLLVRKSFLFSMHTLKLSNQNTVLFLELPGPTEKLEYSAYLLSPKAFVTSTRSSYLAWFVKMLMYLLPEIGRTGYSRHTIIKLCPGSSKYTLHVSGYDRNSNAGMYTYNLTKKHYIKRICRYKEYRFCLFL